MEAKTFDSSWKYVSSGPIPAAPYPFDNARLSAWQGTCFGLFHNDELRAVLEGQGSGGGQAGRRRMTPPDPAKRPLERCWFCNERLLRDDATRVLPVLRLTVHARCYKSATEPKSPPGRPNSAA